MRVVFMGPPDFAAQSLSALMGDGSFEIAGVFTQPDRPRGRGMKSAFSPVKELARKSGLPIFQPVNVTDGAAAETVRSLRPDVLVVVAYGKILPEELLELPKYGAVNVHGSLLPKYRGAAPIQWSVLNGDELAGVTTMYMSREMDAGDIIYQDSTPIGKYETAGELFERLAVIGARLLVRTLKDIQAGTAPRTPQELDKVSYVKQLDRTVCAVDWSGDAKSVIKHICGLDPWPGATAVIGGNNVKLWRAEYTANKTDKRPGEVVSAGKGGIEIACGSKETVMVTELQSAAKKRLTAAEWLLGHPLSV